MKSEFLQWESLILHLMWVLTLFPQSCSSAPMLSEHSWFRSSHYRASGSLGFIYYHTQGCSLLHWQAVWFRWNNDLSGISVVLSSSFLKGRSLSCQLVKFKAYKNLLILFVRQFFFFLPSFLPPSLPSFLLRGMFLEMKTWITTLHFWLALLVARSYFHINLSW